MRVLPRRGRAYSPERRGQAIGMLRRLTPQKVVSSVLRISPSTVSRWWMRYQRDPEKKVPKARKSTGQSSRLEFAKFTDLGYFFLKKGLVEGILWLLHVLGGLIDT